MRIDPPASSSRADARHDAQAMMVAATAAAFVEAVVFNPLTVLRSRLQVAAPGQAGATLRALRPKDALRGVGPALYSLLPRRVWSYTAHQALMRHGPLAEMRPEPLRAALCGLLVGMGEGFLFTPTRRLATQQQLMQGGRVNTWNLARSICAREGVRGLWRGAVLNTWRTGIGGAAYYGGIFLVAGLWSNSHKALQGAAGATACALACNPMDVVLTRSYAPSAISTPWTQLLPTLVRQEGPGVLYRGLGTNIARGVPSAALNYATTQGVYSAIRPWFDDPLKP